MIAQTNLSKPIHNIFQKGLIRGSAHMPYDPEKAYFYVEHPDFTASGGAEGWRVYLRACCFIHEKPHASREAGECVDPSRFVVVKRTGKPMNGKEWEPPKGQMEGKDGLRDPKAPLLSILRDNVKREVAEESRIQNLQGLRYTGLVFQGVESDYQPNTFFQYHIFQALVTPKEWMRASAELDWCREHPAAFARMKRDKREKDMLSWFSPSETRMMGRWSPRIVAMYLKNSHHL